MTSVHFLVLHYKQINLTEKCLASIQKLTSSGLRLDTLVVNNNPKDNLAGLEKNFPDFRFVETGENLGFVEGNNFGLKILLNKSSDWIFLVNNDTVLEKDLVVRLTKKGESNEKIGILGPKIYFAPGCEFHRDRYRQRERGRVIWYAGGQIDWKNVATFHQGVDEVDEGQFDTSSPTDFVSGCAMMIRREVIEKIGLLDSRYFMYLEDGDYCMRARKAGYRIVYEPGGFLWHANAASSSVGGELHDYFLTRNRLLFGLKYAPQRTKLALIRESAKMLVTGRPWQKKGIRDFYLRRFGRGSWKG